MTELARSGAPRTASDGTAVLLGWARALEAHDSPTERAAECARKLGGSGGAWQDCHAGACPGSPLLIVQVQGDCGGDSCDGKAYALGASGAHVALPFGGHKACAPDGSFVVADVQLTPATEEAFYDPRRWQIVLDRFPLDGAPAARFAACMSPALAPDGAAFACRNPAGDVLRVPLQGGEPQRVAEAGVPPEQVAYNPQSYLYPAPPRFESGAVHFTVETNQQALERSAPWPLSPAR